MSIKLNFPGGSVVEADYRGHRVRTDQPVAAGGGDTAPAPFDLFLVSIATCAGFYAVRFCQERGIATEGLEVSLDTVKNPETKRIGTMAIDVKLPQEFPLKYRAAIVRSIDQCAVKRHIVEPPGFEIRVDDSAAASGDAATAGAAAE
jgi:putative redox protein